MKDFDAKLEKVLRESVDKDYKAIVGIVKCGNKFLLGLAKNTHDDRNNRWLFPGGKIKRNETLKKAVEREVFEETGIKCTIAGEPFTISGKESVAFVLCKARPNQEPNPNSEFTIVGFFTTKEMKGLKLYHNVMKLIDKA